MHNSVLYRDYKISTLKDADSCYLEHTLLVTEDGVAVLTARQPDSPGGPIAISDMAEESKNSEAPVVSSDTAT